MVSFPATAQLGELFNVDFEYIKRDLNAKGLDPSSICMFIPSHLISYDLDSDEILRLISTASILFYFLYHSQKTNFPVDLNAIKQFISKARSELESVSRILYTIPYFLFSISFHRKMIHSCKYTLIKVNQL